MEDIGMAQVEDEIRIIAREEYKEEYNKIEKEKLSLQKENREMKKGIKKLSEMDDLSPKAKNIVNSLMKIN
jgi:hypothetical protein